MNHTGGHGPLGSLGEQLQEALARGDLTPILERLDDDATWGFCAGREQIVAFVESALDGPAKVVGGQVEVCDDRLIVSIQAMPGDGAGEPTPTTTVVALFVDDDRIVEICDAGDVAAARRLRPVGPLADAAARPVTVGRVAPVLPVADIGRAAAHYRALGAEVRRYEGDAPYAFVTLGQVELHLAQVVDLEPLANTSAVYLFVDDADALYATWRRSGVGGRLLPPVDTGYGLREGSHVDPDGNLLRFGSPSVQA